MDSGTNRHYDAIATEFDELFGFWYAPLAKILVPLLDLNQDVRIADIGGGTGAIASSILQLSGHLNNPICVVDPSSGLISKAKTIPHIVPIVATAEEFFSSFRDKPIPYDRIVFCQSVHHLSDHKSIFQIIYDGLPKGAVCVLVNGDKTTRLPLWKSIKENFGIDLVKESLSLKESGFTVRTFDAELILNVTKKKWYNKLRKRIFSSMSHLSDEEIEANIKEIDATLLCNVQSDENIEMIHNLRCVVAIKS